MNERQKLLAKAYQYALENGEIPDTSAFEDGDVIPAVLEIQEFKGLNAKDLLKMIKK